VGEFVWRHSIARPRKPPVRRNDHGNIPYNGRVMANFVLNFVAMATGVGRGIICLAYSISRPRKPPIIHKDLADIWHISRVVSNFFVMATGGGRSRIYLASFNSPTPKTPR